MKRAILCCLAVALLAFGAEEEHGEGGHAGLDKWKWINFALLVGLAGYFIYKKGGGFFAARTAEIQRGIAEASRLRQEAEARYAEIERRLAGLGVEVERLREQARTEWAAESARVGEEARRAIEKLRAQAEREIATAARAAQQELRAHAAQLAVELAERKIRYRLTPEVDAALVAAASRELARQPAEVA